MIKKKAAHGEDGVNKFIEMFKGKEFPVILDIGSGDKRHYNTMKQNNILVRSNDVYGEVDYLGNYNNYDFGDIQFDGIHASHVLEHQPNAHNFLKKIYSDLKDGGWLCITVPPWKDSIVGGHVSLWNAGLILYHLVLAGFDCKEAKIKAYGYNISVIVQKKPIEEDPILVYDSPDMVFIKKYIPPFRFTGATPKTPGSFNGNIKEYNW